MMLSWGMGKSAPWLTPDSDPWKCLPSAFLCGSILHPHSFFLFIILFGLWFCDSYLKYLVSFLPVSF